MSAAPKKEETQPITGSIPLWLRQAVEDYRWDNRMNVAEVVREAFEVWAKAKGINRPSQDASSAKGK